MAGIPRSYGSEILTVALTDGSVTDSKIHAAAAIANTKLAAPKSYFTVGVKMGDLASATDDLREFQMPFAATLVEVSAVVQAASGSAATVDVLEAGTTVLTAPIDVKTAAGTPQVAAPADAAIADNAVIGVKLTQTGSGATTGGFVLLTFKVAHCA